jgi:hypothetical protein
MNARELFEQHRDGAKELAIAMAIPAAAAFLLVMLLPPPEPIAPPAVEVVTDRMMPTASQDRVWTWPLPADEPAATEETTDEDPMPRHHRRHHGRRS